MEAEQWNMFPSVDGEFAKNKKRKRPALASKPEINEEAKEEEKTSGEKKLTLSRVCRNYDNTRDMTNEPEDAHIEFDGDDWLIDRVKVNFKNVKRTIGPGWNYLMKSDPVFKALAEKFENKDNLNQ